MLSPCASSRGTSCSRRRFGSRGLGRHLGRQGICDGLLNRQCPPSGPRRREPGLPKEGLGLRKGAFQYTLLEWRQRGTKDLAECLCGPEQACRSLWLRLDRCDTSEPVETQCDLVLIAQLAPDRQR